MRADLAPSPEQLALLGPVERFGLRLGRLLAGPLKPVSSLWAHAVIGSVAWLAIGRRLRVHGLEHLAGLDRKSRVILVANHRSFFDFFVIGATTSFRTGLPRRDYFPVRATFFYDRVAGLLVNLLLSAMTMFPPILRDPRRGAFNRWALARTAAALSEPGTLVGLHPEGTRNKGPDAYDLLEAQPGVGKIVLEAPEGVVVVPVFVLGLTSALHREVVHNWTAPDRHPVNVLFGPPLDLSDLRAQGSRPATQKRTSDRCLEAIRRLAEEERAMREAAGVPPPPPPRPRPDDPALRCRRRRPGTGED